MVLVLLLPAGMLEQPGFYSCMETLPRAWLASGEAAMWAGWSLLTLAFLLLLLWSGGAVQELSPHGRNVRCRGKRHIGQEVVALPWKEWQEGGGLCRLVLGGWLG